MGKVAMITGVAGQDGSYLVEFLLRKGYFVLGIDNHPIRLRRLGELLAHNPLGLRASLQIGDVRDRGGIADLIDRAEPDEIYNLAAQSHVGYSFDNPSYTTEVALALKPLLEAALRVDPLARIFQASTSEMFGDSPIPQAERSGFRPLSPYAQAKQEAHEMLAEYRKRYGIYAVAGIMFNHESPRRRPEFVSRKITRGIAEVVAGCRAELRLGNLSSRRDWAHAQDYVEAMWLMLQQEEPGDLVIATGESRSVEEFAANGFALMGLNWRDYVTSDPALFRPTDPPHLRGDSSIAYRRLGWRPKTSFDQLVREMLRVDLRSMPQTPRFR
ncbi:GDP-mannose 4,6-dehydratase [Streptomyces sp. DT193]|uniref:GDP-mannose 4,6-dehydratase n=1 Tax=Streptomyces sp. DT193 TaxID=3393418 RepID=UPI003CE699FA